MFLSLNDINRHELQRTLTGINLLLCAVVVLCGWKPCNVGGKAWRCTYFSSMCHPSTPSAGVFQMGHGLSLANHNCIQQLAMCNTNRYYGYFARFEIIQTAKTISHPIRIPPTTASKYRFLGFMSLVTAMGAWIVLVTTNGFVECFKMVGIPF